MDTPSTATATYGDGASDPITKDLEGSGLELADVNARMLGDAERATTGTPAGVQGYVLPYFDVAGHLKPFYRVRLFNSNPDFRQPRDALNHIYYPKLFYQVLALRIVAAQKSSTALPPFILLTEGEKSTAAATRNKFPCVGIASPEAWKNRTLLIPGDAALTKRHTNQLAVRLPPAAEDYSSPLAVGLTELISLLVQKGLTLIIISPTNNVTKEVDVDDQLGAAGLGFELRYQGVPFDRIRHLVLPTVPGVIGATETTLDTFLMRRGADALEQLIADNLKKPSSFPLHPHLRTYISERLSRQKLTRKDLQEISISVLSDFDGRGRRLRSQDGQTYYFDQTTHELLVAEWPNGPNEQYREAFTQYLYQRFGLAAATSDKQLLVWLGTQFASEKPISLVEPQRVLAFDVGTTDSSFTGDRVLYQISDSQYIEVNANGFKIHDNGDQGILFQGDQVEPLDKNRLIEELEKQSVENPSCWWAATLAQVRLRDKDKQRIVAALLYYMSPWLFRWRGMQLPVELVVGESGSGKSTLCELRLTILSGRSYLRNTPGDIKDWYASILNTGGLHVTDNVQFADKQLRQKISDEVCRIITEPEPFVEQRKYYTNAEQVRIPVRAVFAITAIQQPFINADILQRSFILELDKSIELAKMLPSPKAWEKDGYNQSPELNGGGGAVIVGGIRYDSSWKAKQLANRGGREGWIAHHLVVLQRFFAEVQRPGGWDNNYQAKHRLINFEQAILVMARIFGIPSQWIPNFLATSADHASIETDWVLSGLHEFSLAHNVKELRNRKFYTATVCDWALEQEEFRNCDLLVSPHKLAKYMKAHKSSVFQLTGILEVGKENNKVFYQFRGAPLPRRQT